MLHLENFFEKSFALLLTTPILLKKNRKKLKKVVDKPLKGWYYSQRCSERQH